MACFGCACSIACGTAEASRDGTAHMDSATAALVGDDDKTTTANALQPSPAAEDLALRRSYYATDMKVHACVTRRDDGHIIGKNCPPAFVLFGPYVTVPANSDVQLRFDIEARSKLSLTSDMISNGAKQFHGALDEQLFDVSDRRSVSYRIRVFEATRSLETRIGIRADAPVDFEITNLEVNIQ